MSEVSTTQTEKITQHPLETVLKDLKYLVKSLETEIEVAPSDRKAHQDLLRRIKRVSEAALQIPDEAWLLLVEHLEGEAQELTKEEPEFFDSIDWITEGKIGEEIDVEAVNRCLKEHGYEIQLSFPETPKDRQ